MRVVNCQMIEIEIDGRKITAEDGDRLLWVALEAGIYIPHLCAGRGIDYHPAACRLCFVEVKGSPEPVTSCTTEVADGMVVRTRTDRVDRLVRTGFELLMSVHRLECKVCPAKERCELLEASRKRSLPLRSKRMKKLEPDLPVDTSHPHYGLDPNKCVLCGKCVHVANQVVGTRVLDFQKRGLATVISTFDNEPLVKQDMTNFDQIAAVCPVGAIFKRS